GLDVAVHYAMGVREAERVRYLARDPERLLHREPVLPGEPRAKRLSVRVGQEVEERAVRRTRVVHRQDVRMLQPRGELDLPEEAVLRQLSSGPGREDLDRDRPSMAAIHRAIHHGRGAVPDLVAEQNSPAGQVLSKARHSQAAWDGPRIRAWKPRGVRRWACLSRRLRGDWSPKPHS